MQRQGILFIVIAALALAAGFFVSRALDGRAKEPPEIAGFVASTPRALPPFELRDGSGESFGPERFRGDWSFVYFGYTYCPDICPMSMVELADVKQLLADDDLDNDRYYLVSVDPNRDSPERMTEYVTYFDETFRGLTGEPAEIDKFTKAAGVAYDVPEAPEDDDYLVGHSSTVTLINPDGNIHAFFTTPLEAETIAADFLRVRRHYEATR